jgi:hypothetical protein
LTFTTDVTLCESTNQNEIFVRFWLLYIHLHLTNPTQGDVSCESQLMRMRYLLDFDCYTSPCVRLVRCRCIYNNQNLTNISFWLVDFHNWRHPVWDFLIVIYTPTSNQSHTGWRQLWKSTNQNEIFVRFWLLYIHLHRVYITIKQSNKQIILISWLSQLTWPFVGLVRCRCIYNNQTI